jgi:hypothetical protein
MARLYHVVQVMCSFLPKFSFLHNLSGDNLSIPVNINLSQDGNGWNLQQNAKRVILTKENLI